MLTRSNVVIDPVIHCSTSFLCFCRAFIERQYLFSIKKIKNSGAQWLNLVNPQEVILNKSTNIRTISFRKKYIRLCYISLQAPSCLNELLKPATNEDLLLRWTTLLANILTTVKEQKITSASLPADDKAPSPETMYTALYGVNSGQLKSKVYLLSRHKNENISHQASKVYQVITKM